MLPIYQRGVSSGMKSKKVVDILLHPRNDAVARAVPTSVCINAAFVVDTSAKYVGHIKNVLADDLGAWHPTGTKQQFYRAPSKRNPLQKATKEEFDKSTNARVYRCTRSFFRNKSAPDLQRIVIYLTGKIKPITVEPRFLARTGLSRSG